MPTKSVPLQQQAFKNMPTNARDSLPDHIDVPPQTVLREGSDSFFFDFDTGRMKPEPFKGADVQMYLVADGTVSFLSHLSGNKQSIVYEPFESYSTLDVDLLSFESSSSMIFDYEYNNVTAVFQSDRGDYYAVGNIVQTAGPFTFGFDWIQIA